MLVPAASRFSVRALEFLIRGEKKPSCASHLDREARVFADLHFPILIKPAEIAMAVALGEGLAMLDDGFFDLL